MASEKQIVLPNRYPLILLIVGHFVVDLYGSFLSPLQPFLIARHGLSLVHAGFLVSLFSISASLLQPVYGLIADRLRRNIFVVIGPLLAAAFMSGISFASNYFLVMLFLFLGGVGVASFHPQASSLNHNLSGDRKGLSMSLFISAGNFGSAVGPLAIMAVVNQFGLGSAHLAAVPGIVVAVLLLALWPPASNADAAPKLPVLSELRKFLRPLSSLYTIVVLRTLVHLSFLTYIPVLLKQQGFSPVWIGGAITALMAAGAVGGMAAGFLYDRIGGRNLFIASSLISPIFLVMVPQVEAPFLIVCLLALSGFFLMMTIPISVLMGQTIVPNAISTVSSLMMGFGWGTGGLLIPLVGAFADRFSIPITLSVMATMPWLFFPLTLVLPKFAAVKRQPTLLTAEE